MRQLIEPRDETEDEPCDPVRQTHHELIERRAERNRRVSTRERPRDGDTEQASTSERRRDGVALEAAVGRRAHLRETGRRRLHGLDDVRRAAAAAREHMQ